MSRIYINGTNIPNVYVNGQICPTYFNGMLITDSSEPPSYIYNPTTNPQLSTNDYYTSNKNYENFVTEANALNNVSCVILLIRHGARDNEEWGPEGQLNERGKYYSENYGLELYNIVHNMKDRSNYYGTEYYRTQQTAAYIAKGTLKNTDTPPENWINNVIVSEAINGNRIMGNETDWTNISNFCYSPEKRSFIIDQSRKLIDDVIGLSLSNEEKWSIMVSHDQLLAPLIIYALNFDTSYEKMITASNWVRFLSGIGIVFYTDDTYELVPVMGNDDTFISV